MKLFLAVGAAWGLIEAVIGWMTRGDLGTGIGGVAALLIGGVFFYALWLAVKGWFVGLIFRFAGWKYSDCKRRAVCGFMISGLYLFHDWWSMHLYGLPQMHPLNLLYLTGMMLALLAFWVTIGYWLVRDNRRLGMCAVALLLAAGVAFSMRAAAPASSSRTNVLWLTIDTLRPDRLGFNGHAIHTPNIDALARESQVFTQTRTIIPQTPPSFASMHTSLFPSQHGIYNAIRGMNPNVTTAADRYRDLGYSTAGFISASVLHHRFGFGKGFDRYDDNLCPYPIGSLTLYQVASRLPLVKKLTFNDLGQRDGKIATQQALNWIESRKDRNFFVWLHLFDVHDPYGDRGSVETKIIPTESEKNIEWIGSSNQKPEALTPEAVAELRKLYDSDVEYVDGLVGQVVSRLKELGLDQNTLIVLASDHGEELTEHRYEITHTVYLYDAEVRIVFAARVPGWKGARHDLPVSVLDILPTTLGVTHPDEKFSEPMMGQNRLDARPDIDQTDYFRVGRPEGVNTKIYGFGVRKGEWGYFYYTEDPLHPDATAIPALDELYNYTADPGQLNNLASDTRQHDRVARMRARLFEHEATFRGVIGLTWATAKKSYIDRATLDRLCALGYIQCE